MLVSEGVEQVEEQRVSRAAGIRVREADLGSRAAIGSGAATEVFRLDAFTVPGHQGGLAFVRLRDRDADRRDTTGRDSIGWDRATLSKLIALRWGLDARERAVLDGVAAWPLAVVEGDEGEVVGCLVPLAAHPFYYLPAGDKTHRKVPQPAKWLVNAPKRARRAGAVAVGERDLVARATVLARVCLLLGLLHRQGVVFGDLSDRSVLFGIGEVAEAFVVGGEGAAFAEDGVLQRNSAGWAAPEAFGGDADGGGESGDGDVTGSGRGRGAGAVTDASMSREPSVQTVESDRYKLGLLILRVLAPAGDGLERSRDADRIRGVVDDTGHRMMREALGDDPSVRPSAAAWYQYLRGVIVENLEAPVILSVEVSPALVAEGDEVRLDVSLSGAQRLTIEMPGRADITREISGRSVSERFTARQSGRIGVRAANEHGETAALSNLVRVLPVPAPSHIAVASPEVPGVLGILPDLAPLQAALGIASDASGSDGTGTGSGSGSPFERVAELRERIAADALPLNDVLRIGLDAERVSRDRHLPSFEDFLTDITTSKDRPQASGS
ncbi:hypothetical protein ACEXQD_17305 [Herbiconiux sp. P15]|uniref:hypothetical protein n=1 Tax=Herbiconiux liukaitaii TaxID=3342799 RepID=UPI0035BAA15A